MKTCYIHIGLEKTGTTTIQKFLSKNRDLLRQQGFFVPQSWENGFFGHNTLAIMCYDHNKVDNFVLTLNARGESISSYKTRAFEQIKQELQESGEEKVIFSSELIQSRLTSFEEILKMRKTLEDLGFRRFKIIVYLREQTSLVKSLFYEAIKWDEISIGDISNFLNFENTTQTMFIKKTKNDFQHICNHEQTLKWYSSVFGKGNLSVRIFEKDTWCNNNLIDDFLCAIGATVGLDYQIPENQNETIDVLGLKILDFFNREFPSFIDNSMNVNRDGGFYEKVQKEFRVDRDRVNELQIPMEILEYFQKINADGNRWVRDNFFPDRQDLFSSSVLKNKTTKEICWSENDLEKAILFCLKNPVMIPSKMPIKSKRGILKRILKRLLRCFV